MQGNGPIDFCEADVHQSEREQIADEAFPFPSYRQYQEEAYKQASKALYERDKDVVILNLPTGVGKSGICTGLANQSDSAFLTTPMKSLRTQLEEDEILRDHYNVLRARDDYICSKHRKGEDEKRTCATCPVGRGAKEDTCRERGCEYWTAKEDSMAGDVATLTFAYLILDQMIPAHVEAEPTQRERDKDLIDTIGGQEMPQISYQKRDLLVADEIHKIEDYVASLFAGTTVSPYNLPRIVYGDLHKNVNDDDEKITDVLRDLFKLEARAKAVRSVAKMDSSKVELDDQEFTVTAEDIIDANDKRDNEDIRAGIIDECDEFIRKFDHVRDELEAGRDWVVTVEDANLDGKTLKKLELKPIDVDYFLKRFVWSRANKIVLSTATMPFSNDPERWLRDLGLGDKSYECIQYPMPFEKENRPVETSTTVGKLSGSGMQDNWGQIVETMQRLSDNHAGEKGLIHTASYDRAQRLYDALGESNAYLSEREADTETEIEQWQASDKDMFLSPSCMDGVDLKDDMCRWQVLLKVPYPYAGDSRVSFKLDERNAWDWYYESTALKLIQSVGRGVRSREDYCTYYVLDRCFNDVMDRASVPTWFTDAIQ